MTQPQLALESAAVEEAEDGDMLRKRKGSTLRLQQVHTHVALGTEKALTEVLDILSVARAAAEAALHKEDDQQATAQSLQKVLELLRVAPPSPEAARLQRDLEEQLETRSSEVLMPSSPPAEKKPQLRGGFLQARSASEADLQSEVSESQGQAESQGQGFDVHSLFRLLSPAQRDEFAEMYVADQGEK